MGKTKAVAVIRVSTARQADEDHFGVEAQQAAIDRLVRQYDLEVVETISYNDVSGDMVLYAPEMQRLLKIIQRPEIGAIVAKEFSRLVRPSDFADWLLLQRCVEAAVTLYLPSGPNDLSTSHGRFMATIQGAVAGLELSTIKARMMDGREESRKLGYCAAGGRTVPTGVIWDVKTKTWSYDDVYAPKIATAFEMVAGGETNFQYIINKLHLRLRPARGAPKPATPTSLRRLLENRLFIGERVWDKKADLSVPKEKLLYSTRDGRLRRRTRPLIPREPHETYVRQVISPGLVTREVFDKVQTILRGKSDRYHESHALHAHTDRFAYRGMLFCADCGQPLYTVARRNEQKDFYRCRDHFRHRGGDGKCKAALLLRSKLEAELDRLFSAQFGQNHFFAEYLRDYLGRQAACKGESRRRAQLEAQQKQLSQKRERIIEYALDGTITKEDRDRRLRLVNEDLEVNRRAMAALPEFQTLTPGQYRDLARRMGRWSELTLEEKRRLIASTFQEVKVKDYRVVSLYLLTGELSDLPERVKARQERADRTKQRLSRAWTQEEIDDLATQALAAGELSAQEWAKAQNFPVPEALSNSSQRL